MSRPALQVVVSEGAAEGATELSAFDAALQVAGVAHFNILRLSSLLPPGSRVVVPAERAPLAGEWGDRLYAVYAEHRTSAPGELACAGLGWVQDEAGAGLFVEHHGTDEDRVRADIEATLADLEARRPARWGARQACTTTVRCSAQPVAAVVVAAFAVEGW